MTTPLSSILRSAAVGLLASITPTLHTLCKYLIRRRAPTGAASAVIDWYEMTATLNQGAPLYTAYLNQTMAQHVAGGAILPNGTGIVVFGTG